MSRPSNIVKDSAALKKRVMRLLRLDGSNNRDPIVGEIIPELKRAGHIALIGGAIRDLAMAGRHGFKSDLDFVAYGKPKTEFAKAMTSLGGIPNKFGGYGLQFGVWGVDIWHIQDTWAKTNGIKRVDNLDDLLKCTFFDWDSIVFDLTSGRLIHQNYYLERLKLRILEINLEENPNPKGSLIRSIRRAALYDANFGPRLTRFAASEIEKHEWSSLVDLDTKAFSRPMLAYLDKDDIISGLTNFTLIKNIETTKPIPKSHAPQLEFALSDDDRTNLSSI